MIARSNIDLATITGRGAFVCQTETDRSSDPRATTEQMFAVVVGPDASLRKIRGLHVCGAKLQEADKGKLVALFEHTATSTAFSWPTRLISVVQDSRRMTVAMKTRPF
jgi:hypothetical protein